VDPKAFELLDGKTKEALNSFFEDYGIYTFETKEELQGFYKLMHTPFQEV